MNYAKIENGRIAKTGPRPRWYSSADGAPLSDVALREHGYLPIVYDEPIHDPRLQRLSLSPQSEWAIETKRVVASYIVHDIPLDEAIETARQAAYERINSEYEARTQVLAEGYPVSEQQSWPVQIKEADIVLTGGDEPTPWIDSAAPARGISRTELAQLIKSQDTAYRQYHGALTGTRQALRDQIAAAPDGDPESVDTLYEIGWPVETEEEPA